MCFKEFEKFKQLYDFEVIKFLNQKNISCIGY